jgi:hypothetical protein
MEVKMPVYKNRFKNPAYIEETILDENGDVIGPVRLKPSTILWKPNKAQKFYAVKLDKFSKWIIDDETRANRTIS